MCFLAGYPLPSLYDCFAVRWSPLYGKAFSPGLFGSDQCCSRAREWVQNIVASFGVGAKTPERDFERGYRRVAVSLHLACHPRDFPDISMVP